MKEVKISGGKVMLIDDEDFDLISRFTWSCSSSRDLHYAQTDVGGRCRIYAHRLILGAQPDQLTDHIDGNGLNNQRSNLRLCSKAQNCQHARRRVDNSSGYIGVSRLGKGFRVVIKANRKTHYLGYFSSAIEGAKVYNEAAKKYHGEFATLNTIEKEG